MTTPLILDFDQSVGVIADAAHINLANWQEKNRFGSSLKNFNQLCRFLDANMPENYGTVMLGSGDYHHLSCYLLERIKTQVPFQLIVLDNHPDNMRFPFGIHCGSWVRHAAMLPFITHVHVVGITSRDIGLGAAFEQYWRPLLNGKLTYWSTHINVNWAAHIGLGHAFRGYETPDEMIADFIRTVKPQPTYLSIDKDVLSPAEVKTNWDQGMLREQHMMQIIAALGGQIIGSDITGEVSEYRYHTWWKKLLSVLDGQTSVSAADIAAWQIQQHALNQRLLAAISASTA